MIQSLNNEMSEESLLNLLSNKKVLYAEDEEGISKNVIQILEIFFNEVINVTNGQDALDYYYLHKPDVVILDICMPEIDGIDVVKEIRKDDKKVPVLILSAHTEQEYLWRAIEQKICKFLTKPFNKQTIIDGLVCASLEISNYSNKTKINEGTYDFCLKVFEIGEESISLSKNESKMLEYLISKSNQIVTYEEIFDYIWSEGEMPTKDAIKAIIKDLRKIIGKDSIKNVFAVGYKLEL